MIMLSGLNSTKASTGLHASQSTVEATSSAKPPKLTQRRSSRAGSTEVAKSKTVLETPLKSQKGLAKRKNAKSFPRRLRRYARTHTWFPPLVLVAIFGLLYAINPSESNLVSRFIFLSYKQVSVVDDGSPIQYGKGVWDVAFVTFYIIVLSFAREFVMQEILRPLARYYGIRTRGKQLRYMEQMYAVVYFAPIGLFGLYVMRQTPVWYFNTRGMYESFPHKTHEAAFKFYYLFQAAYWAQQAIVMLLGQEKARKDFKELVIHHVVTLSLISVSYRFHFTYIGVAVYVTHDISDFALALSKSLHYIDSPAVGPFFASSIATWIYLRNYQNLRILYSVLTEFRTVGPYEFNWDTEQYKGPLFNVITFTLLAALQGLNVFWLYFLARSAYKFVVYNVQKDDRSEDDDEVEEKPESLQSQNKTLSSAGASGIRDCLDPSARA